MRCVPHSNPDSSLTAGAYSLTPVKALYTLVDGVKIVRKTLTCLFRSPDLIPGSSPRSQYREQCADLRNRVSTLLPQAAVTPIMLRGKNSRPDCNFAYCYP